MPFPFTLPTTSSVVLTNFFTSPTHPSLPLTATTKRSIVRDALKKHKRLPAQSRDGGLSAIHDALADYIPYLLALDTASSLRDIGNERIDVEVVKPLEAEWRTTLSGTIRGREAARPKFVGLHFEIAFTLTTLGYVHYLLARSHLKVLYGTATLSAEQRSTAIKKAVKCYFDAHGVWTYLSSLPTLSAAKNPPVDVQPSTISALASLAIAEATLAVISQDDPYAVAVADNRNEQNSDWMFKSPTIPKVRASLFARFCLAAAEHASKARGLLSSTTSSKVDDDFAKYVNDLYRTARGKATRFIAIDKEISGSTGEALAYLKGGKKELGLSVDIEDGRRRGLRGLRQNWQERREDRRIEKDSSWGSDAGRYEEARVIEMLQAKWEKENSAVNTQIVPPFEPLLASLPSGRDYPAPARWAPPVLEVDVLVRMRAPLDPQEQAFRGYEADSGDEGGWGTSEPVGAFPGTEREYGRSTAGSSYY